MSLSKFFQMNWTSRIFWLLPFDVSQWLIRNLGRLYYLVHKQEQALITATIRPLLPRTVAAGQVQRTIRAVFRGIFDHYHEKLFVGYSDFPRLKDFLRRQMSFQGLEQLQAALTAGRGVILVTGHFGAVEFLPGALALSGLPTSMICRFQSTRLRGAQGSRSRWIGLNLIESDQGQGLWKALQALKAGRIVIIECDEFENWRPDPRQAVTFLRQRLCPDRTLEVLQRRAGAPVITALVQRQGQRHYTCQLTPVSHGVSPVQPSLGTRCLEILETAIETHPEQWYQWKEFAKMIKTHREVGYDHQEAGYLAPEPAITIPDQA